MTQDHTYTKTNVIDISTSVAEITRIENELNICSNVTHKWCFHWNWKVLSFSINLIS